MSSEVATLRMVLATLVKAHADVRFDTPEDTAVQAKAVQLALDTLGWDRKRLDAYSGGPT